MRDEKEKQKEKENVLTKEARGGPQTRRTDVKRNSPELVSKRVLKIICHACAQREGGKRGRGQPDQPGKFENIQREKEKIPEQRQTRFRPRGTHKKIEKTNLKRKRGREAKG